MLGLGFKNRGGFEKLFGALFGGIPLLLSLIVPWTFLALIGLALVVFSVGYLKGDKWLEGKPDKVRHNMSPKSWRRRHTSGSGASTSRSSSSSWSSSSGSSSGSSSSSGSFGGGSSGGGGASGKW